MSREYGITREEALLKYSYSELQELIAEIPIERVINISPKDTKASINKKWLQVIADFDSEKVNSEIEDYRKRERMIELKLLIKTEKDKNKIKFYENQLKNLQL